MTNDDRGKFQAEIIAINFLANRPCALLSIQREPELIKKVAYKLSELDPSQTTLDHLSALYNYILSFPRKCEEQAGHKHLNVNASFWKLYARIPSKLVKRCFTDSFLSRLNEQLQYHEAIIPERELIAALKHIIIENCEPCRLKAQEPIFVSSWALSHHCEKLNSYPINDLELVYRKDCGEIQ